VVLLGAQRPLRRRQVQVRRQRPIGRGAVVDIVGVISTELDGYRNPPAPAAYHRSHDCRTPA
jgi:hypothetical protein